MEAPRTIGEAEDRLRDMIDRIDATVIDLQTTKAEVMAIGMAIDKLREGEQ